MLCFFFGIVPFFHTSKIIVEVAYLQNFTIGRCPVSEIHAIDSFVSKEDIRGKIEIRCWSKRACSLCGLSFGEISDLSINMKPFDNKILSASRNEKELWLACFENIKKRVDKQSNNFFFVNPP